jgi:hypothetical protein
MKPNKKIESMTKLIKGGCHCLCFPYLQEMEEVYDRAVLLDHDKAVVGGELKIMIDK